MSNGDVQQSLVSHKSTRCQYQVTHAGEGFSFWLKH